MRFYGFEVDEIAPREAGAGMLDLDVDPKLAWALRHPDRFPVDVNTAAKELLLRVPGFGTKTVKRVLSSRRFARLRLDDLARLGVSLRKVLPFVQTLDHRPRGELDRPDVVRARLAPAPVQSALF
jgi:predicted DNA-binding helix-hairpin-helix protein